MATGRTYKYKSQNRTLHQLIGEAITQQVELKGSVPIQIVDDIPETPPKKPSDDDD